jgi:hypothetical protein
MLSPRGEEMNRRILFGVDDDEALSASGAHEAIHRQRCPGADGLPRHDRPLMHLAFHDVHLECPVDRCRRMLQESTARWLPAAEAHGDGRFLAWLGFGGAIRVDKEVEVTIGPPAHDGDRLVIPIGWRGTGLEGLFPVFDGAFRLRPLRPSVCRLSLVGTYEPPLGELGRRLDGAGLRQVAEATIRDLAEAVAARISVQAGTPAQASWPTSSRWRR